MDAVREIDLETSAVLVLDHFINSGRTKILARVAVFVCAAWMADIRLQDVQMARLIFVMRRTGIVDIRQFVEGQFAVVARRNARQIAIVIFLQVLYSRVAGLVTIPIV